MQGKEKKGAACGERERRKKRHAGEGKEKRSADGVGI